MFRNRGGKRARVGIVSQQWKNADFASYPTQFIHRLLVENEGKRIRIEEEQVCTKSEVKRGRRKGQFRKLRRYVTTLLFPELIIANKVAHCFQAQAAQLINRCDVVPNKFLFVLAGLSNHLIISLGDSPFDLDGGEMVEGVAGNDLAPASSHFGIEAGRPKESVEYPSKAVATSG